MSTTGGAAADNQRTCPSATPHSRGGGVFVEELEARNPNPNRLIIQQQSLRGPPANDSSSTERRPATQRNPSPPPASKSAVKALPEFMLTAALLQSDEPEQCAICKEELELGGLAVLMPCKHVFHKFCILPWLELRNSCPLCRYQLPADVGRIWIASLAEMIARAVLAPINLVLACLSCSQHGYDDQSNFDSDNDDSEDYGDFAGADIRIEFQ